MENKILKDFAEKQRKNDQEILDSIKKYLPEIIELKNKCEEEWGSEDSIYRFYHQSFKVYYLQDTIKECVELFKKIGNGRELNEWYLQIIKEGTENKFSLEHNKDWLKFTRPIVEAYFHSKHFLDMMVKYQNVEVNQLLPTGWAMILYLYNSR